MIWYDMIYNTLNTPTDIISRPWVSVARESYFMWDSPWLVNLWRRPLSRWCLGNMFLSLQPLGHFWWPLQSTGFTLSRWVSQWIGWAPVPTEWDGKVLHRSAQNGTGAWKEMCRSCRAMPEKRWKTSQASITRRLISPDFRSWPNPASVEAEQDPSQLGNFLSVKPSFLLYTLYNGNRHRLTRSVALLFAPLSQPLVFVWSTSAVSFSPVPCVKYRGPERRKRQTVFAGGLRATPGVARNAKTFGSLKSLTLKFKALVLHNLDWAESSSIKVIGNHWDILRLFDRRKFRN